MAMRNGSEQVALSMGMGPVPLGKRGESHKTFLCHYNHHSPLPNYSMLEYRRGNTDGEVLHSLLPMCL